MAGGGERVDAASIIVVPLLTKGDASEDGSEVLVASRGPSSSSVKSIERASICGADWHAS